MRIRKPVRYYGLLKKLTVDRKYKLIVVRCSKEQYGVLKKLSEPGFGEIRRLPGLKRGILKKVFAVPFSDLHFLSMGF